MSITPVDTNTGIPLENRWKENKAAPAPTHNAGLYSGPAFSGPWGNIPVTPTTANMIHNNLRSANPPPGATTQYPGTNRSGNSYTAMPGVSWYTSTDTKCPYKIKVTENTSNNNSWCANTENFSNFYFINK